MKYHISFDIDFKRNPYKGRFIALEGIDGSGKTTQALKVVELLNKNGYKAIYTKEPTGGIIGKLLREQILSGKVKVPPVSIQYLMSADRAMHQEEITEELKKGTIVVTDRYFWSAVCYGIADLPQAVNYYLTALSVLSPYTRFLSPDVTFFLDLPIKSSLKRIGKSLKHREIYDNEEKLKKIKKAYDLLKEKFVKEFAIINADREVDEVTKDLFKKIAKMANAKKAHKA